LELLFGRNTLNFNHSPIINLFNILIISVIISLLLGGISLYIARKLKLIDLPGSKPHKQHTKPTPIAGGIALLFSLLFLIKITNLKIDHTLIGVIIASLIIFLFGIWDDYKNIQPNIKLIGQVISAIVIISTGTRVRIFESPEFFIHGTEQYFVIIDQIITIFWIVAIVNAFNLVDSMDGLAVGLGTTSAAFFVLFSLESQQFNLSQLCTILLGTLIGIYFYNSPPAKLFLGDSGAQLLGLLISIIAIIYSPMNAFQTSSWLTPILILGVPIFDTSLVIFSRLRRNLPIYESGLDHTYHRLLHLGVSPNQSVLLMQIASLILGSLAFLITYFPPILANLSFAFIFIIYSTFLVKFDSKRFYT
jgi:UDP-GlcNAc:undecaprenyl-phosphate/decaprenyl-phosphate GlcNAc-1-phosphate transferase